MADILDRCDAVVGSGAELVLAGRYKVGEGDAAETRYKYGIKFNYPEFTPEQDATSLDIGRRRQISVEAASIFNQANDYGSQEDAEAFQKMISSQEGWTTLQTVKKREGGGARTDSTETLAIKYLANVLKKKVEADAIGSAAVAVPRADDPPKTEKGITNYNAWAKILKAEEHPWYKQAYKKVAPADKGFD